MGLKQDGFLLSSHFYVGMFEEAKRWGYRTVLVTKIKILLRPSFHLLLRRGYGLLEIRQREVWKNFIKLDFEMVLTLSIPTSSKWMDINGVLRLVLFIFWVVSWAASTCLCIDLSPHQYPTCRQLTCDWMTSRHYQRLHPYSKQCKSRYWLAEYSFKVYFHAKYRLESLRNPDREPTALEC